MKNTAYVTLLTSCILFTGLVQAKEPSDTLSIGYARVNTSFSGQSNELNGTNIKYRHELNNSIGVVGSLTIAKNEDDTYGEYRGYGYDSATGKWVSDKLMYGKVVTEKQHYYSVNMGPSFRLNDYISAYALAGVGQLKSVVSTRNGRTEDKNTALSYSAGVQFNPVKNWAVDIAYEGYGSGDKHANAFIVGLGYRF